MGEPWYHTLGFFIELNGVSNQSICISTDQSEGKVSNAFYIQYYLQYKYFRKLKAAGAEQSQSCLQWLCFCCFVGRGTSCDWWEFVWVRRKLFEDSKY